MIITHYSASTPFIVPDHGCYITLLGLPDVAKKELFEGKTLRVERIEIGIWEGEDFITQKINIEGNIVPHDSPYLWTNRGE